MVRLECHSESLASFQVTTTFPSPIKRIIISDYICSWNPHQTMSFLGLGPRWVLPPVCHLTWPTEAGRGFPAALASSPGLAPGECPASVGPAPPGLTSGCLRQEREIRSHRAYCACAHSASRLRLSGSPPPPPTGHNGRARLPGPEVEANCRGTRPALLNARQSPPSPPSSAGAEASRSRHVRQRRLRAGPKGQGTYGSPPSPLPGSRWGLAPWGGPTLLLSNPPMGPTLVLGREAGRPHLRAPPCC